MNSSTLILGYEDGALSLHPRSSLQSVSWLHKGSTGGSRVIDLQSVRQLLLVASSDGAVSLYNLRTREKTFHRFTTLRVPLSGLHSKTVRLALSPTETHCAFYDDGKVLVYEISAPTEAPRLLGSVALEATPSFVFLAFSPDGAHLAFADQAGQAFVWALHGDGAPLAQVNRFKADSLVCGLEFLALGLCLLGDDGKLWIRENAVPVAARGGAAAAAKAAPGDVEINSLFTEEELRGAGLDSAPGVSLADEILKEQDEKKRRRRKRDQYVRGIVSGDEDAEELSDAAAAPAPRCAPSLLPFQPASTPTADRSRILAWTSAGIVRSARTNYGTRIDVEFADALSARPMSISDGRNLSLAALCPAGVAIAAPSGKDPSSGDVIPGVVLFHDPKAHSSWEQRMPPHEDPLALAVSDRFVAVATSANRLRILSTGGIQFAILDLPGSPVTACAFGPLLFLVVEAAGGRATYLLLDVAAEALVATGALALTPGAQLFWCGFASAQALYTFDTLGVMRLLTPGFGFTFVPVLDWRARERDRLDGAYKKLIAKIEAGKRVSRRAEKKTAPVWLWPVAVEDDAVLAVPVEQPRLCKNRTASELEEELRISKAQPRVVAAEKRAKWEMARAAFEERFPEQAHFSLATPPGLSRFELQVPTLPGGTARAEGRFLLAKARTDLSALFAGETPEGEKETLRWETMKDRDLFEVVKDALIQERPAKALSAARMLTLKQTLEFAGKLAASANANALAHNLFNVSNERFALYPDAYSVRQLPPSDSSRPLGAVSAYAASEDAMARKIMTRVTATYNRLREDILKDARDLVGGARSLTAAPTAASRAARPSDVFTTELDEEASASDEPAPEPRRRKKAPAPRRRRAPAAKAAKQAPAKKKPTTPTRDEPPVEEPTDLGCSTPSKPTKPASRANPFASPTKSDKAQSAVDRLSEISRVSPSKPRPKRGGVATAKGGLEAFLHME